jgi:hypothetical protein
MKLLFCAALLFGCDDSLLGAGQTCASSGECGPGLLCDFGKTPHVCAPTETVRSHADLSAHADAAGGDLSTPHD